MSRIRPIAAAFALVGLMVFTGALVSRDREPPTLAVITSAPETTTTLPDFEALVQSVVVGGELAEEEHALTEEAMATTTTSSTLPPETAPPTTPSRPSSSNPAPPQSSTSTTKPPATITPGYVSAAESDFAGRINSHRSSNGNSALSRNGSLDSYARTWAKKMAESGGLGHSSIGSLLPPWSAAAENVGLGGSVSSIFDALVSSSGHRSNMVGDYTHFGIGVWRDSSGRLWTAHVFAR